MRIPAGPYHPVLGTDVVTIGVGIAVSADQDGARLEATGLSRPVIAEARGGLSGR